MSDAPEDDGAAWPPPGWPAPDSDTTPTTWVSPAPGADATPTTATPQDTARWAQPTTVEPATAAPPAPAPAPAPPPPAALPPVAPGWGAAPPPPPPAHPAPPAPPAYGVPAYGQAAYGQPSYARPGQYAGGALPGVGGWGAVPQAPKPGVVPLRPLGVGEILDGAISYIRRDPKTVLGISAVIALVLALVQFIGLAATARSLAVDSSAGLDSALSTLGSAGATVVQQLVGLVMGVLATGLLTVVMGQAVLGRRVSAGQAWERTKKRFWPLLGLTLLVSLIAFGTAVGGILLAVLVGVLLGQSAGAGAGVLVGVPLGLAAMAAGLWLYVKLLLAPVALILEAAPVVTSMRRSWRLVQGAWWRTFGIYLLGSILAGIVGSVLSIPFAIVGMIVSLGGLESGQLPLPYLLSTSLGVLISSIVIVPFSAGIVALLYIDRRIRREALDIELARAAGIGG